VVQASVASRWQARRAETRGPRAGTSESGSVVTAITRPAPILTIAALDEVWLRLFIPLPSLGRVALGQTVEVRTDAYPDRTFRPDEPVTRAGLAMTLEQVLAVVTNDLPLKTRHVGQQSPFADVRSDHFAFNAAVVVTTRGLMEAERPSGAFRLAHPVSGPEALLAMRKLAELF